MERCPIQSNKASGLSAYDIDFLVQKLRLAHRVDTVEKTCREGDIWFEKEVISRTASYG